MTQLANVVLKDYEDSDVTFVPRDMPGGVATVVNSTGVPVGDKTLSFSTTKTQAGRRKSTLKMVIPIVQNAEVAGVSTPTVVRTSYVDITFSFAATSNTDERRDVLAYIVSALKNTGNIKPLIEDYSAPF
jgi:hypothetical protein